MQGPRGEPPFDPALAKEFRLWQTALADHGQAVPDGKQGEVGTPLPPVSCKKPTLPTAIPASQRQANERKSRAGQRSLVTLLLGPLILAILVARYRDSQRQPTAVNRASVAPPVLAPPSTRTGSLDEADRLRADQADYVAHTAEVLAMSGEAAKALPLFRQSLSTFRELAGRHPSNARVQQALASGWDKLADTLVTQGDSTCAFAAYREAGAAWGRSAAALPEDRDVQRSRSLNALSLGNVLLARNDSAGAAEALRRGALIQETLCRQEPGNAAWQEDLGLEWLRLSDALEQQGDRVGSREACRRALAIEEALVSRDAANLTWQSDLATAHAKAGDLLLADNEVDSAVQEYTTAASGRERLAAADASPERRLAAAEMKDRLGQALEVRKQPAAALPVYQRALGILAYLATESPTDPSIESLHATVYFHEGRAMANCHLVDQRATRLALHEARDHLVHLKSADGGTDPSPEQAQMLMDVERLLVQLDE